MKQTDPGAPWYRRFRMLMGIYVVGMLFGLREYSISRSGDEVDMLSDRWAEMTRVVEAINPEEPDTEFLESIQAMRRGDATEYVRLMEEALAQGVKHNDILMQAYAQQLLSQGADFRRVNLALNTWRENHPLSAETIWLPLAVAPRDATEAAALRRAMEEVDWISGWELHNVEQGGVISTQVHFSFRPPEEVDIREAVAAVSILGLSPEERARYRVVCLTLRDCNTEPR